MIPALIILNPPALVRAASDGKHRPASHPVLGGVRPPMERTVPLCERITAARQARGWSCHRLAREVGVSHVAVMDWERGTFAPAPRNLARLEQALGVSLS